MYKKNCVLKKKQYQEKIKKNPTKKPMSTCHFTGQGSKKYPQLAKTLAQPFLTTNIKIHSAYLGQVEVQATSLGLNQTGAETVLLQANMNGTILRILDAKLNKLNVNEQLDLRVLATLPAYKINVSKCTKRAAIIDQLRTKQLKVGLSEQEVKQLHVSLIHNYPIDVFFNICQMMNFCSEVLGLKSFNNSPFIPAIVDVAKFDNAFFAGNYFVFGNGNKLFYPLGTSDISIHETGHSIIDMVITGGLKYEGHSGCLHESFSDMFGTSFEFYLYKKFNQDADKTNDLKGQADFMLGEDNAKGIGGPMRFMGNPEKVNMPSVYQGKFWKNPNDLNDDYGAVHTNSAVTNLCFVKACERMFFGDAVETMKFFFEVLKKLCPPGVHSASLIDFRDRVKTVCAEIRPGGLDVLKTILLEAGLGETATSDQIQKVVQRKRGRS